MMWFFSVLVVVVMGLTAMVAAGRFGGMAEAYDDRPDSRVPDVGPLTAEDLEAVRFTSALRGYRMSEVDALLDRLTEELRAAHTPAPDTEAPVDEPVDEPVAGLASEPASRPVDERHSGG